MRAAGTRPPGRRGAPGSLPALRGPVVLELPFPSDAAARRALIRAVYRRAARALREELGYPGAALALEAHADALEEDAGTTVVDAPAFADAPVLAP